MAFESVDFESKLFEPTKALMETVWNQVQSDLVNFYLVVRNALIELHSTVAELGKIWYDNPIETTQLWFDQLVEAGQTLYARFNDEWRPELQNRLDMATERTGEWLDALTNQLNYVVEHPEQITVESIEAITETVTSVSNASSEVLDELKAKSEELIQLLLDKPLETLENVTMEALNALLNSYFELVSSALNSVAI